MENIMEVIGFILIVGMVLVFFVVTKIGAKTNMSDEEREKALKAFYSQPVYDVNDEESETMLDWEDEHYSYDYDAGPGNVF